MTTSSISAFILIIIFAVTTPIFVHAQADAELVNAPSCTAEQIADWSHVREKRLGVAGRDVFGHEVGFSGARKRFGWSPLQIDLGGNWMPISGRKETLCGTLNGFGFFPGVWEIDREEDWNNFIIPDADFKYLITDVHELFPRAAEKPKKCPECIEVEITVHDDFFENPYFTRNKGTRPRKDPSSILTNQKLCTYGTWIREKVHDDQPELHPSELFWWTAPAPSGTAPYRQWWLLSVQDSSNRFNSNTDFDPTLNETSPWAGSPKTNQFMVALEVKPNEPMVNFRLKQHENHGVMSSPDDGGTTHLLKHNGVPLVSVTEEQATEKVGVGFNFCRDESANRFVGYLELTNILQADSEGYGGFQVLQLIKDDGSRMAVATPSPSPAPLMSAEAIAKYEIVPDSLKRIDVDGQPRLVADIQVEMARPAQANSDVLKKLTFLGPGKKAKIQIDTEPALTAAAGATQPGTTYLLRDVPFGLGATQDNARFEIETPQGKRTVEIKDSALVPEVRSETAGVQSADQSAVETLLRAAGLAPAPQPESALPIGAAKTQTLTVDIAPTYAPLRNDGTPAREDESAVVSLLNESIQKAVQSNNFSYYERVFKTQVPFRMTTWNFKAINVSTREEVPVREVAEGTEAADSNEVRVVRGSGMVANGNIRILFPKQTPGVVYEFVMSATMEDANNNTGTFEHHVWSHHLTVPRTNTDQLLRLVSVRAGLSYDQISALWQPSGRVFTDVQTRRAQIFRTQGLQAVQDEKVTLAELDALARAAKLASRR